MTSEKFSNGMDASEMKLHLDTLAGRYNNRSFIASDPVSIPHSFTDNSDIEASAFLTATIAWGRRDLILRSAVNLLNMMGNEPYKFITGASEKEIGNLSPFVHRTFNGHDAVSFMQCLRHLYSEFGSMEEVISDGLRGGGTMREAITHLHKIFFTVPHESRTERHLSDVSKGSAGKKMNMFLRWMVRKDDKGVDFGIWKKVDQSLLFIPLDLHAGNTARRLGLLTRRQNDWKAVEELTALLRKFDPADPVKYDFALFGAGVNGDM
ncbi:MAG TPA: TIGR02757 family protein [Bacteroidales bacterium]|nr:TIGR02757 family protein [Bacteroidales bacterium]